MDCREDQNNDSWSGTDQALRDRAAEGARRAAAWSAQLEHGPEGPHVVTCDHAKTHVPMHRWDRTGETFSK